MFGTFGQATRLIWLDGRAHPPEHAAHTWAGFSTGRWDGNSLEVFTTHLKLGWLQRNGVAHSDRATMTERFIRHGNYLTVVTIVDDPIYLEEPFIRTTNWVLNPDQEVRRTQFDVVDEVAVRRRGEVPHYLPGSPDATRKLTEFASKYKLPADAARGIAATLYPSGRGGPSGPPDRRTDPANESTSIQTVHIQGNVHMIVGAGANIIVQAGDEGVLVIDTGAGGARRRGSRGHSQHFRQTDPHRHQHACALRSHGCERS